MISIAIRNFFLFILILDVKLVLTNIILLTSCKLYNQTILDVLHEILHQIIVYDQQGK